MDELFELVQSEKWSEAWELLQKADENNISREGSFFILASEIALHMNRRDLVFEYISEGLSEDPFNYELYYMLGIYYSEENIEKAYLCYEMAAFYAGNTEDEDFLLSNFNQFKETNCPKVNPASIVIVSYNCKDIMMNCISSIRDTNPSSAYELVVVDNNSTDGIAEWLKEQTDIVLQCNDYNAGFGLACNQGVELATKENDIFFLNNDTIVPPNALFWLRMGLYENDKTGAVGSVTNAAANGQRVNVNFDRLEHWLLYANKINVPMTNYYEKKIWLVGYALMIKRNVLDKVGLFDLQFGIGNYEDNDLGMRILQAGYELHLCRNCFIYHFGSMGFKQNDPQQHQIMMEKNRLLLKNKWGFDISYYTHARSEIIDLIKDDPEAEIHVLEIGCGAGATLAKIKYLWPNAVVKGIELDGNVVDLGKHYLDIIEGNVETIEMPYEKGYFDYIIFADVLEHLFDPDKTLQKVIPYLKEHGCILTSIPNIMHVSVLLPLLHGNFDYQDAGILDRTHVRFFTLNSVLNMMQRNNLNTELINGTHNEEMIISANQELYQMLVDNLGDQFATQSKVYQYVVKARK